MRTITKTFELYTIDELEQANKDGYDKAIKELTKIEQELLTDFEIDDYIETITGVETLFNACGSYDADGYNAFYRTQELADGDTYTFKDTYLYVVDKILPQVRDFDADCLTGFFADYDALKVLKDFVNGDLKTTSISELVDTMCKAVLDAFNDEYQSIETDFVRLHDRARFNEYEFTKDGTIYRE